MFVKVVRVLMVLFIGVTAVSVTGACSPSATPGTQPGRVEVEVVDNQFDPSVAAVAVGGVVTWMNEGKTPHNITPVEPDERWGVKTSAFLPGDSYTHTFSDAGTYRYYCTIHGAPDRGQHGAVEVGDPRPDSKPPSPPAVTARRTIHVPGDAATIQGAVREAGAGDTVLISPGTYHESITITSDGVTIRGTDRNTVVLDGQHFLDNGVRALGATGVRVENLTIRDYAVNGVFLSAASQFSTSYMTVTNTGRYGIYSYDSHNGEITNTHNSGTSEAGIYIGQCDPCDTLVLDNVSEQNATGVTITNAGEGLTVAQNTIRDNRVGIVINSGDYEELAPQRDAAIIANLITNNNNGTAPTAGSTLGGLNLGIIIAGGSDNTIERNTITDHELAGIAVIPFTDTNTYQSNNNTLNQNTLRTSGLADIIVLSRTTSTTCLTNNELTTTLPADLQHSGDRCADPNPPHWNDAVLRLILPTRTTHTTRVPQPPAQPTQPEQNQRQQPEHLPRSFDPDQFTPPHPS